MKSKTWTVREARANFADLLKQAAETEPQTITQNGKPAAVVVSVQQWEKIGAHKPLVEALRECPSDLTQLDTERSKEAARGIDL